MMTRLRRVPLSVLVVALALSLAAASLAAASPEPPGASDAVTGLQGGAPLRACPAVQDAAAPAGSVPSCIPAVIAGSLGSGSAAYPGASGTASQRLFRDGIASTCASQKPTPPLHSGSGPYRYDAYAFTHYGAPACVTVELSSPAGSCMVHPVTYSGSFNSSNVQANYLADSGNSATSGGAAVQYGFMVGTDQRFVVVVSEPYAGSSPCPYSLKVTGTTGCPQLWGYVFLDTNGNGIRDTAENKGVADVRITLTPDAGGPAFTISDGFYQFVSVPPGAYCAAAAIPARYQSTTPASVCVNVSHNTIIDFGVQKITRLSGFLPLVKKR